MPPKKFIIKLRGKYLADPYFTQDELTDDRDMAWVLPEEMADYICDRNDGARAVAVTRKVELWKRK